MTLRILQSNPGILHIWTTLCHTPKTSKDDPFPRCVGPRYFKLSRLLDPKPAHFTRFSNHQGLCANVPGIFRRTTRSLPTGGYYPFNQHVSAYDKEHMSSDVTEFDNIVKEIARDQFGGWPNTGDASDANTKKPEPLGNSSDSNTIVNSWIPIHTTSQIVSSRYFILGTCLVVLALGMCCWFCWTLTQRTDDVKIIYNADTYKYQSTVQRQVVSKHEQDSYSTSPSSKFANDKKQQLQGNISQNNSPGIHEKTRRRDKFKYPTIKKGAATTPPLVNNVSLMKVVSPTVINMESGDDCYKSVDNDMSREIPALFPSRQDCSRSTGINTDSQNICRCQRSMMTVRAIPALAVLPNSTDSNGSLEHLQPTMQSHLLQDGSTEDGINTQGFSESRIFREGLPRLNSSQTLSSTEVYIPSKRTLSRDSWYDFTA